MNGPTDLEGVQGSIKTLDFECSKLLERWIWAELWGAAMEVVEVAIGWC